MAGSKPREISLNYVPRAWQEEVHRTRRRFCIPVVHRRGGKTEFSEAELTDAALRIPGAVLCYLGPTRAQSKAVIWERLKAFLAPIPGMRFSEVELRAIFPNGSVIFLQGALDGADHLRGVGLDGIALDEFALFNDSVFPSVIRPALADRKGFAIFISTPRGRDPLWRLIQQTRGLPDWSHYVFPASATGIIPHEELEAARATMPPDVFAREFMCDFSAAPPGSIYGATMRKLREAGRILPTLPWLEGGVETFAALDLGISDATSAWVGQNVGAEVRLLAYREWSAVGLADTGKTLRELGVKVIYAPHDIKVRELVSGRSRLEALESLGFDVEVAPQVGLEEGIAAAQALLPHCCFDEKYAGSGIEVLENYSRDLDEKNGAYGKPRHDRWSHGADALRYLALCLSDRPAPAFRDPTSGRVWSEPRTFVSRSSHGVQHITLRKDR